MLLIGGLLFVLACVFGSFAASGGMLGPLVISMPFELITILGAAIGTYVMANSMDALKHVPAGMKIAFKGPKYGREDYLELLRVMYQFVRLAHAKGVLALETHIEEPQTSSIFAEHTKIRDDSQTCAMICDYWRLISMSADDPYQIDEVLSRELKKNLNEEMHFPHALQTVADALPALGIVAAVLGVIKTMASISKPPVVLGEMIAGALVGTFLGVLLAYGIVAPLAARIATCISEDASFHNIIRSVLVAHLQGNAPPVSIEIGRKDIPGVHMPSFQEVETSVEGMPAA
ncbi:flagellar motor stator protein MotA [Brytella acorum]|uniref:Flagellar motor stator protein MotA n=1 Tax=Brytella acorum TaxID=2959299 RepID=A0AA35Y3Y8_9PROT|nr:flagellar motor stator protein MotA [Brytella acorum]MDF3624142.1 flagellar motor stator protein MotA [Brytella acorum]CAI9120648.1 flagellar motor stator protein MotA [Brytella acorum]